jgi:hypothetical protein
LKYCIWWADMPRTTPSNLHLSTLSQTPINLTYPHFSIAWCRMIVLRHHPLATSIIYTRVLSREAWRLKKITSSWLLCGANAKLTNSMPKKGPSSQHPEGKWLPNSVDLFVWYIWRLSGGFYRDRISFLTCIMCECSQWRIQIFDKKINLLHYLTYLNI